jgi:tetratricopeptide (TPR) repeat protein
VRKLNGEVRWSDVVVNHVGYQDIPLRRRKLERDLRLLQLEDAEHPDHPFTLFNLGCIHQELGQMEEAIRYFQRSLARSQPADSIVRKVFALLAQCHGRLGHVNDAIEACQSGRQHYPDDAELLFQEGLLRLKAGDKSGAEKSFLRVLGTPERLHFASVDTGVRGYKSRNNLAAIYKDQGRLAEAEAQWQSALAECPGCLPAWEGLAEIYLEQRRWEALEKLASDMESADGDSAGEGAALRSRGYLARQEFGRARRVLEEAIGRCPTYSRLHLILGHVLLQEGQDWVAAEKALRDLLALEPRQVEARRNLALLLERQGRPAEGAPLERSPATGPLQV